MSSTRRNSRGNSHARRVRYAVLGLGHISQVAALPAFAHARRNSELVALVSGDPAKRRKLGRRYGVPSYGYEACDELFSSGNVDAVYIGLPNHLHCAYTLLAARNGVHVLCEKPMAVTALECRQMIRAAEDQRVKLMIAPPLRGGESARARDRALREARRASHLLVHLHDAGEAGQHPRAPRSRRRNPLRHRHLLPPGRAPALSRRPDRGLRGKEPEPSGLEGTIDVEIIEALQRSAKSGGSVRLPAFPRERAPSPRQARRLPPVRKPKLVRAESASR